MKLLKLISEIKQVNLQPFKYTNKGFVDLDQEDIEYLHSSFIDNEHDNNHEGGAYEEEIEDGVTIIEFLSQLKNNERSLEIHDHYAADDFLNNRIQSFDKEYFDDWETGENTFEKEREKYFKVVDRLGNNRFTLLNNGEDLVDCENGIIRYHCMIYFYPDKSKMWESKPILRFDTKGYANIDLGVAQHLTDIILTE